MPITKERAIEGCYDRNVVHDDEELGKLVSLVTRLSDEKLANLRTESSNKAIVAFLREEMPAAEPGWAGPKPLGYSEFLATSWGLHTPYEQYGLYGTTLAGLGYSALSLKRAHTLMLASMEPDASLAERLMLKANAKELDVRRAVYLASKFRTRGLLAAIGAPMLWLGFMTASNALNRERAAWVTRSATNADG